MAAQLDLTCGLVLMEVGDTIQAHPIYLGRTFVNHAPVDSFMRGYDVVCSQQHFLSIDVLQSLPFV